MASVTPHISNLPLEDPPAARQQQTMSSLEAKVESVIGIGTLNVASQGISNDSLEEEHAPIEKQIHNQAGLGVADRSTMVGLTLPNSSGSGSPQKIGPSFQGQGQHFEPLDKSVSQTVKLNPKMELSKPDLLKLLSFMEAELQARDVVIATLKTERIKNLLHYGRVGLNDPFLALQRDSIGGQNFGNVSEGELRSIEETQLQQLENLITQQRKAHQRMRQILREAEKRHSWTVEELEKERRKQENDCLQDEGSDYTDGDKLKSKQTQELDFERAGKRKIEKELKKLQETLEEERGKQKQIILMLVDERKRLALQYVEERKRSEDLAQILSEEKGRIDSMAEGLEEESKKSLQMEAELEKQLAEFDTEKQQMAAQLARKDERIYELETLCEKLQREVEHYKKQLQEAHNVAMFQQTLSVSPPRIGIGTSPQRPQPPQLPVKPPSLAQGPSRLQAAPAHSNVTKAVQLTATVNSVPVAGPTTGIARGVQPGIGVRSTMYSASSSEINRPITSTAKTYSESENAWVGGPVIECDSSSTGSTPSSTTPQGIERSLSRVTGGSQAPQVVQVSPRVNVSASSSNKVITTSHGGKVTFHVTTNTSGAASPSSGIGSSNDQTILKKPAPPTRTSQAGPPPPVPLNKPIGAPPVPPNKPIIPPKKVVESSPISVEVKPQKVGPQTVKFGITISKTSGSGSASVVGGESSSPSIVSTSVAGGVSPVSAGVESVISSRRENSQVEEEAKCEMHECVDSLCHELENFHQLLSSMADQSDLVGNSTPVSHHCPSGPALYSSCDTTTPLPPLPPSSVGCSDQKLKNDPDLAKDVCKNVPKLSNFISASSSSSTTDFTYKVSQLHNNVDCISKTPPSHSPPPPPLPSSSPPFIPELSSTSMSSSSSSHSSYVLSDLSVTFPLVSECEESSASTQTCKGPPMSIPQYMASIPQSPAPLSSPFSPSSNLPRPQFLPVDSTLEYNLDDCVPPPHSPIDVASPLTADGMTALHLAAQGNNWQSIPVLVRCGSSVIAEDDEGRTPLYLALLYGCVPAAKALLGFPQNIEHSTKSGCNFLHAATKSGEVECVSVISHYILKSTACGLPLLHLLATSPDHHGHTPVALALAATSSCMIQVFWQAGIDIKALIAHNPQLLHAASSASLFELSVQEDEVSYCPVLIKSVPFNASVEDEATKWSIGTVAVSPTMQWNELEMEVLKVVVTHWQDLENSCIKAEEEVDLNDNSEKDAFMTEESLGLSESSVEYYCIFGHYWKKGEVKSSLRPYELMKNSKENCFVGDNQIIVHLNPIHASAYASLVPVSLLKNYLNLLDQSQCFIVYGAEFSGKKSLVNLLASLQSGGSIAVQSVNLSEPMAQSKLVTFVEDVLISEKILVLQNLPRESWQLLWGTLKKGNCQKRGKILATMNSWRRPSCQLENDVLWVQLRFDRPPLRHFLLQHQNRQIASLCAGVIPPDLSFCSQMIRWVCHSQARLCDTLMSLGFSSALKGPGLLVRALAKASNPTDIIRGMEHIWNKEIAPLIVQEVHSVWKTSPLYGKEQAPNESRVSTMALHVIFRRSFLTGRPQPPKHLLVGFQSRVLQHPKDFVNQKTLSSPSSPDWNEDSLAKLLGLPPMGYAS